MEGPTDTLAGDPSTENNEVLVVLKSVVTTTAAVTLTPVTGGVLTSIVTSLR